MQIYYPLRRKVVTLKRVLIRVNISFLYSDESLNHCFTMF